MQYKLFIAQKQLFSFPSTVFRYSGIQKNKRHIPTQKEFLLYYNKGLKPTYTPLKNY